MLATDPIPKVVFKMAVPTIVAFLINSIYSLADTYFVSGLGESATAAVSVNASLDQLIMMCGSMLAVEALADNILGFIGMYSAYLGGLDAVVFTGGIGTGSGLVRKMVCEKLAWMGLNLDEQANEGFGDGCITAPGSKVRAWRLKTNEELVVARCVYRLLHGE